MPLGDFQEQEKFAADTCQVRLMGEFQVKCAVLHIS